MLTSIYLSSLTNIKLSFFINLQDISMMFRVFAHDPEDLGSIPGRVIPNTQKMVLDASLLNSHHYKVWIKGKVEQSMKRSSAPPLHLGVVAIKKGAFGLPSDTVANFTYFINITKQITIFGMYI